MINFKDEFVIGIPLLKTFYTIFDESSSRIGFLNYKLENKIEIANQDIKKIK